MTSKEQLANDQELATKLAEKCSSQSSERVERRKNSAEELAISETTKLMHDDDDMLELSKATLPSTPMDDRRQ